jgi:Piwi domain
MFCSSSGLKGTSKPVLYRTLWNENFCFTPASARASPLDGYILEQLTYNQSYQYGTATKAIRLPAVVLYSNRLAMLSVSLLSYLFDQNIPNAFESLNEEDGGVYRRKHGDAAVFPAIDFVMAEEDECSIPIYQHVSA